MERGLERWWRREKRSLLSTADPKQFICSATGHVLGFYLSGSFQIIQLSFGLQNQGQLPHGLVGQLLWCGHKSFKQRGMSNRCKVMTTLWAHSWRMPSLSISCCSREGTEDG